jgi:hypothetical protein
VHPHGELIADVHGLWDGRTRHHSGGQSLLRWCKQTGVHPSTLYIRWATRTGWYPRWSRQPSFCSLDVEGHRAL